MRRDSARKHILELKKKTWKIFLGLCLFLCPQNVLVFLFLANAVDSVLIHCFALSDDSLKSVVVDKL